jgi:protein-S-isoprenylcysteine O-methyltransferase Ste14
MAGSRASRDGGAPDSRPALIAKMFLVSFLLLSGAGGLLFGVAGTFDYPGAWILLAVFLSVGLVTYPFFLRRDPEFLAKRLDYGEKEKDQKRVLGFMLFPLLALLVVPALDRRLGWTPPSRWTLYSGGILFAAGYAFIMSVLLRNRYASRTVKIQEGQRVIDTGPYAVVRHPLYAFSIPVYAAMPLILQSAWGLVPLPFLAACIALRAVYEERFLKKELPGYAEYMARVRWRLLPFVW